MIITTIIVIIMIMITIISTISSNKIEIEVIYYSYSDLNILLFQWLYCSVPQMRCHNLFKVSIFKMSKYKIPLLKHRFLFKMI